MVEAKVVIANPSGMHTRAAAQFVSFVYKYDCDIFLIKGNKQANAKSILNLLILGLNQGSEVTVSVSGEEEEKVLKEVVNYICSMKN